jgi:glycosyltransferase involved in cell wall biosynthesis
VKQCRDPQELALLVAESDIVVATWCMTGHLVDALKGRRGIPAYYCQHYEPIFFFNPEEQAAARLTYDLPLNLIANSPWLAKELKTKHNRDSTIVCPGVDLELFKQSPGQAKVKRDTEKARQDCLEALRKKIEAQPSTVGDFGDLPPFKILAFASQQYFKGFYDTLLPALQWVAARVPLELHLYGNAALPQNMRLKVVSHGFVKDEQLAELYNSCDLYVNGSHAESSPLPQLEAMACGTPVLCTEFGTEHFGKGIARVSPLQPRTFAEKLANLLSASDLREKMVKQGLIDVQEFTWEKTVDSAEKFFQSLLGEA